MGFARRSPVQQGPPHARPNRRAYGPARAPDHLTTRETWRGWHTDPRRYPANLSQCVADLGQISGQPLGNVDQDSPIWANLYSSSTSKGPNRQNGQRAKSSNTSRLTQGGRNQPQRRPKLAQLWSTPARPRSKRTRHLRNKKEQFGRFRTEVGRNLRSIGWLWPKSTFGRSQPKLADHSPHLADIDQDLVEISQRRSNIAQIWPDSTEIARHQPNWQNTAKNWPKSGPTTVEYNQSCSHVDQHSPKAARCD